MTSKTDILHNALCANGFEPDEKLSPLAYIAAAESLASRCAELEEAMLQARADRDHKEAEADSFTFFGKRGLFIIDK